MPFPGIRTAANLLLFAGWIVPVLLGRLVIARLGPETGADPARLFTAIGGVWAFLAVVYGVVLAVRVRRGLGE